MTQFGGWSQRRRWRSADAGRMAPHMPCAPGPGGVGWGGVGWGRRADERARDASGAGIGRRPGREHPHTLETGPSRVHDRTAGSRAGRRLVNAGRRVGWRTRGRIRSLIWPPRPGRRRTGRHRRRRDCSLARARSITSSAAQSPAASSSSRARAASARRSRAMVSSWRAASGRAIPARRTSGSRVSPCTMSETTITAVAITRIRSRRGSGALLAEVSGIDNAAASGTTPRPPPRTPPRAPARTGDGRRRAAG